MRRDIEAKREYERRYYAENRDRLLAKRKTERVLARRRERWAGIPDERHQQLLAAGARYRQTHKDRMLAQQLVRSRIVTVLRDTYPELYEQLYDQALASLIKHAEAVA